MYQEFPEDLSQNREGNRRAPRLLAASVAVGFFACAYPVTNSFFDFGRVDMLCLCFSIFALLAGRKGHAVVAALLWTAAFETKQGVLSRWLCWHCVSSGGCRAGSCWAWGRLPSPQVGPCST